MIEGKLYKSKLPVGVSDYNSPYYVETFALPRNSIMMVLTIITLPYNFTADRIVEVVFLWEKKLVKRRATLINLNHWLKAII